MNNSIKDYDYFLPKDLIADSPREKREQAKLMIYDYVSNSASHSVFAELSKNIEKGDILILNDTKVIPGRLFLKKESGGTVEILFHKSIGKFKILCIYKSSRKIPVGSTLHLDDSNYFLVENVKNNYITLSTKDDPMNIFLKHGSVPLPKYIKRDSNKTDVNRYQTVYAKHKGSVAAPTAGLHFTDDIISELKDKGVIVDFITLHVTYNTFKPIKVDNYMLHDIGSELCHIREDLITNINNVKKNNKKVYAVGTTVTRALENYASKSHQGSFFGDADLYITPGYKFKIIDGLITNYHLPQSTLLLLVASFIGKARLLKLYELAISQNYRFYSYGDSMFIKK